MSENRKYYYLKLKENFFTSEKMVILESMQDGLLYSNLLLKMYLMSLKYNGILMLNDRLPHTPQTIATFTRHQIGTVERAIKVFMEFSLVEILTDGAFYMTDIQLLIGQSSTEGERKKRERTRLQRQNLLPAGRVDKCPPYSRGDICPPEIRDKRLDIRDKSIDIELDIDTDKEKASIASRRKETFPSIINNYTTNADLIDALNCYVDMRKKEKKFTPRALKINLTELDKLALDDLTKIDIINQTIGYGWKGFYPLKKEKQIDDGINNPYKSKGRAF